MPTRKTNNGRPVITNISPSAAIPGGELRIHGKWMAPTEKASVTIGDTEAPIIVGSDSYIVARVPEGVAVGSLVVGSGERKSVAYPCDIGVQVADGLHPVANPAIDSLGNIYVTLSGSRGQKTPVSVFKVDKRHKVKPFLSELMNASGLAFDRDGMLYVSSRNDGVVYQVTPEGQMSPYVEGMGVATGLAFDEDENLYVGDRSGTVFKVSRARQIYVFATLEPSIAAYHLAFGPGGSLYVTGPTTSSFDSVYRIDPGGNVEVYYRGLGRPQGVALDADDHLYVAASMGGRRGIVRIDTRGKAELFLSGPGVVGLGFAPNGALYVTTTNALYRVNTSIPGRPLP